MKHLFEKFIFLYILLYLFNNFKDLINVSFFLIFILLMISFISLNFFQNLKNKILVLKKNELLKNYFSNIINIRKILNYYKKKNFNFINKNFLLIILFIKIIKLNNLIWLNSFFNFLCIIYFNFIKNYKFFNFFLKKFLNLINLFYLLLLI